MAADRPRVFVARMSWPVPGRPGDRPTSTEQAHAGEAHDSPLPIRLQIRSDTRILLEGWRRRLEVDELDDIPTGQHTSWRELSLDEPALAFV